MLFEPLADCSFLQNFLRRRWFHHYQVIVFNVQLNHQRLISICDVVFDGIFYQILKGYWCNSAMKVLIGMSMLILNHHRIWSFWKWMYNATNLSSSPKPRSRFLCFQNVPIPYSSYQKFSSFFWVLFFIRLPSKVSS